MKPLKYAAAVENALRKAGINPAHADSDEHIDSNTAKGWLTEEQAAQARAIRANVPAEAEQQINMKKVEMAIKKVLDGKPVQNRDALSNPEILDFYANIQELQED